MKRYKNANVILKRADRQYYFGHDRNVCICFVLIQVTRFFFTTSLNIVRF